MTMFRRTTALVALLAYLALSTLGAGWVVCTGANGHVAIESIAAGCCAGGEAVSPSDVAHSSCEDHSHGDGADHHHVGEHDDDDHHTAAAHIGCGDCADCGDCDDVALSELVKARLRSADDASPVPLALPAPGTVAAVALIAPRPRVAAPEVVPRPPPRTVEFASTYLRL